MIIRRVISLGRAQRERERTRGRENQRERTRDTIASLSAIMPDSNVCGRPLDSWSTAIGCLTRPPPTHNPPPIHHPQSTTTHPLHSHNFSFKKLYRMATPAQEDKYPGKRSGQPQQDIYQSDAYRKTLQPVIDRMKEQQSECLAHVPSTKELSTLLYNVLHFLESAYGKNALSKPFPKLPFALFQDTRPNGAIDVIVKACSDHITNVTMPVHNRKKIDWISPALRKELQELISLIRTELLRAGCMRQFKVYFDGIKNIERLNEMRAAVVRMGGQVAAMKSERGVTHVVVPNGKDMKDGKDGKVEEEEYFWRTVAKNEGLQCALVHWWYVVY